MSSHFKCNHSKFEQYPLQIMKQLVRWKKPSDNLTYMKHALKRNPFLLTKAVPQSRRLQEPCTYQSSTADSEALSVQRAAPLPSWAAKKIQLSPKFSLAQAGPYSSFSMVVFAVLKPAWTSRFASSDSAGKHGIETKLWAHQCVKLKTLAPYKNCLTLQDFFLHIPVAPSSSRRTLVHTRCGISYWVRM